MGFALRPSLHQKTDSSAAEVTIWRAKSCPVVIVKPLGMGGLFCERFLDADPEGVVFLEPLADEVGIFVRYCFKALMQ
jgi:hypothetical protein